MDNQHGNIEDELYSIAYAMGFFLGDGSLCFHAARNAHTLSFECADKECIARTADQIQMLFPAQHLSVARYEREGRQPTWHLRACGWEVSNFFAGPSEFKQIIPQAYFSAPAEVQLELIAGLLDADGCVEEFKQDGRWKWKVVFSNNKLDLITGLAGLLRLQGVGVGKLKEQINYNGSKTYRISPRLQEFAAKCYFRCERKQARLDRYKVLRCASETADAAPLRG